MELRIDVAVYIVYNDLNAHISNGRVYNKKPDSQTGNWILDYVARRPRGMCTFIQLT